jgi:hypothetical protein
MNALLRHISVRLWLTGLAGGLFCLILLPVWERIFGLHGLVMLAVVILAAAFAVAGWAMNRMGIALARHQVHGATAWERAGMIREAGNCFQRAAALFDSFWFSPFFRRKMAPWLYGVLVKFHLSQFPAAPYTRALAAGYLRHHPQDRMVAESWLEGLVSRKHFFEEEHAAAACVGEALGHHPPIQQLLMQFFLAGGRMDFDAQMIYRRAWKAQQPMETRQIHELARLLLRESIINPWTFQVYLKACQTGMSDALAGVAAGLQLVPLGEEGRRDLATARQLVAGLDAQKVQRLGAGFKPPEEEPFRSVSGKGTRLWKPLAPGITKTAEARLAAVVKGLRDACLPRLRWLAGFKLRHALFGLGLCSACGMALLVVLAGRPSKAPSPPPEHEAGGRVPIEDKVVITDPFTIQVAAYLNARDAQKVVDQLAGQKLDAFWTRATGTNRTWYQVKVSHFPTREDAQSYGRDLKSRGLIDDFFVANYNGSAASKTTRKNP